MGLITARVGVRDARALAARLAAHPDFEPAPDEEVHYLELGQQVPTAQRGAMVAEVRAQVRAEGKDPEVVVDRDGSQWWARGRLHLRGSEASVEVDSRARLAGLMDGLAATGGEPAVVEQSRITPGRISRGPRATAPSGRGLVGPAGEAGSGSGWTRRCRPCSVVRPGRPRPGRAAPARGPAAAVRVRRGRAGRAGRRAVDTDWLRAQLKMDDF